MLNLFKTEKPEVVPDTTAIDAKRAAAGLPPTTIPSSRPFAEIAEEMTALQARLLVVRQDAPTLRAQVDRAKAAYRQALVRATAGEPPATEEAAVKTAEQAVAHAADLESGLEVEIASLQPAWATAKAAELQREVVDLQRERTALDAEGARLETEIKERQARQYQNYVAIDALADRIRALESEVGTLWRQSQSGLAVVPGKG